MRKIDLKGQSMMELVVGVGMLAVVAGAIGVLTLSSIRNTQFSKNQAQATKYAQENLEKVRTIKNSNFGVCLAGQGSGTCTSWEGIWGISFGSFTTSCSTGCTFEIINGCTVIGDPVQKPICLSYNPAKTAIGGDFTYQVIIEDEGVLEKRVTSNVFWKDISGEHSSKLVTVMGRR